MKIYNLELNQNNYDIGKNQGGLIMSLDFMFWMEENNFNQKRFEKQKHNIRRNIRAQVGDIVYCPYCHMGMTKKVPEQYCCGRPKCTEKLSNAYNAIKEAKKQ